jgi:beta-lactamase class A
LLVFAVVVTFFAYLFLACSIIAYINSKNTIAKVEIGTDAKIAIEEETKARTENKTEAKTETGTEAETEERDLLPDKVDAQPVINSWVNSSSGTKAVMVYDLDRDEVIGEYNSKKYFNIASLYKLFVVLEGYQKIERGEWEADEAAGYTGHSIIECLDLSIRESDSTCAETLWAIIGYATLDDIIKEEFGIAGTTVSSITSNASDIMKVVKLVYEHKDIKDEALIARMKDSFLNQPATTYDWREGIPSGFSDKTKIYNKTGWDYNTDEEHWNVHHDAAIVETEAGRHYIIVLMTSQISLTEIRELGAELEEIL